MSEPFSPWGLTPKEVLRLLEQTGSAGNPCQTCHQLIVRMQADTSSEWRTQLFAHANSCANGRLLLALFYEPSNEATGGDT